MNPLLEATTKLKRVRKGIIDIIKKEAIKERRFISNLNRDQLLRGEKGDGSAMPNYVDNSRQRSAPGKIKLFDEGDFHSGIEPMFDDEGIEMIGTDDKTPILVGKYGVILDLTKASEEKLRNKMMPNLIKTIKEL